MRELLIAGAFRVRAWLAVRLLLLERGAHGRKLKHRACPECDGKGVKGPHFDWLGGFTHCRRCRGKGRVPA